MQKAIKRTDGWWDEWFIGLAKYVSTASKDPSTKVGAVLVTPERRIVSVGFNGLPRSIDDTYERLYVREIKYSLIVHAERNAIEFATRPLGGCVLYTWPFMPCSECSKLVIQNAISKVVAPVATPEIEERWGNDLRLSRKLLSDNNVSLVLVG